MIYMVKRDPRHRVTEKFRGNSSRKIVLTSAEELARTAGVDTDTYILASNATSEARSRPLSEQASIVRVAINTARKNPKWKNAADMLLNRTRASVSWSRGFLAEQRGGWASTARPPDANGFRAVAIARTLTHGGTSYFNPRAQAGGFQAGKPLRRNVKELLEFRDKNGSTWIGPLPGVDPRFLFIQDKKRNVKRIYTVKEQLDIIAQATGPPKSDTPIILAVGGTVAIAAGILLFN